MQLSSQLLLGSISGLRAAGQAACWALHTLRGQMPDPTHFPLAVKTHLGQHVTVDAVSMIGYSNCMAMCSLAHMLSCRHADAHAFSLGIRYWSGDEKPWQVYAQDGKHSRTHIGELRWTF